MRTRPTLAALVLLASLPVTLEARATPTSEQIHAKAGDLIVVENADRVRVARRRDAQVRTVYNSQQQWLVVLVDYATGGAPDGRVDSAYRCEQVAGAWPLGERWEGRTLVDEYSLAGEAGFFGLGIPAPTGLVQIIGPADGAIFRDPAAAAAVTFRRISRGGSGLPFDVAEKQQVMALGAIGGQSPATPGPLPSGPQPIRVGGTIKTPTKTHDVRPEYPEAAQRARVTGMVILEAVVGTDGSVTDARVVKSIPELDAAALEAVRQWRFTPTFVDGVAVPVIMTVTVNFALQ